MLANTKQTAGKTVRWLAALGVSAAVVIGVSFNVAAQTNTNSSPTDAETEALNQQIQEKQQEIDELRRQQQIYEQQLESRQEQRATLEDEIDTIDVSLEDTRVQLTLATTEIEALQLQIQKVQREISLREQDIADQQDALAELLRRLYDADRVSNLELFVQESSLSGFFSRVQQLHSLSSSVRGTLEDVLEAKRRLEVAKEDLDVKRDDLDVKRSQLNSQQTALQQQQTYKESILAVTASDQEKYASLIDQVAKQQAEIEGEISIIVQRGGGEVQAPSTLSWPVDPSRGITAYFRDPSYPYRRYFEHNAIDIRAYQGTPVKAAAHGIVSRVANKGFAENGISQLNLVYIDHGGGMVTSYLHLSQVSVSQGQTVNRGDVIGLSGGAPGTAGAGLFTTGPHLHFGVFLNGIATDPLPYLPNL